jgi:hypothetical protein
MKQLRFTLSFLVLIISSFLAVYAQDERNDTTKINCPPIRFIHEDSLSFSAGEKLTYILQYRWLGIRTDVGEGSAYLSQSETKGGRSLFHTRVVGSTYKFWDAFFKVRELFESKFYSDNLRPVYFYRDTHEGKYKIKNTYYWNDLTHEISARVERENKEPLDTILLGQECTYDLPTMFYYARNIDFDEIERGVNHPLSFAIDEEVFNIYFRVIGREEKKINSIGTWKTIKFAAKVVAGEVFNGKNEMIIWVTDDDNKIPLYFEVPIIVGTMSGRLASYENVKYPMNCKIEEEK